MPLPAPKVDFDAAMKLSAEEKAEIASFARSIYAMSEGLKMSETCDQVCMQSENMLQLTKALNKWALIIAQDKANIFNVALGLIKPN